MPVGCNSQVWILCCRILLKISAVLHCGWSDAHVKYSDGDPCGDHDECVHPLSAVLISAVLAIIDVKAMWLIWKVDTLDFLTCMGAFFGTLFVSIEIGLLIAVSIYLCFQ
jgi:hypothetical protein